MVKTKKRMVFGNKEQFKKHMKKIEEEGQSGEPRDEHILHTVIREIDRREKFGADAYEIVGGHKTLLPKRWK